VRFEGIDLATTSFAIHAAASRCTAIVICPSNPFVSVGPILQVPGMRDTLLRSQAPIIAVSPIIAGQAVKGPAARMLESLGKQVSVVGVAETYADLHATLIIDDADRDLADQVAAAGARPVIAPILMKTPEDRRALARLVIRLAEEQAGSGAASERHEPASDGGPR
jgi:LPPG:FO 2-phospho-L-lactate transferase